MRFTTKLAAASLLVAASSARANLLLNGDFQTGDLSHGSTTYALDNTMYPERTWHVVSFDTIHPAWVDYFDHTTGDASGYYMIVNGATQSDGYAYRQDIATDLSPNTDYTLSGWFSSLYPQSVAALQFRVMNIDSGGYVSTFDFTAPEAVGVWAQTGYTFNTGIGSHFAVEVWDTNAQASGNDYAIDDLSLAPTSVPEPVSAAALAPAALLLARRRKG